MCLQLTSVRPYQRWSWSGDHIDAEPIVPAARMVPGSRRRRYPIDVRQYLSIQGNAVIRNTLEEILDGLSPEERALMLGRASGSYDFRAEVIGRHVGRLAYKRSSRDFDAWLFPEETLAQGGGDCEDLAFLLASLLEAAGISGYCIRIAFGSLLDHGLDGAPRRWDHAWVVYKNEGGAWQILEPLALAGAGGVASPKPGRRPAKAPPSVPDVEYVPHFVFNRSHLWRIRSSESAAAKELPRYLGEREFWTGYDPSFALGVHTSIFDEALAEMPDAQLWAVKRASFAVDVNVLAYDPREHFDFAYIDEGWKLVGERLASGNIADFGLAAHAIADFYAHSLYAEFAERNSDGSVVIHDPGHPAAGDRFVYDFGGYELPGASESRERSQKHWNGRLISGQWWRPYTTFPRKLKKAAGFRWRRCLPDHDAVAVDNPMRKAAHQRYDDETYAEQFALRRRAAVEHIRQAYAGWR